MKRFRRIGASIGIRKVGRVRFRQKTSDERAKPVSFDKWKEKYCQALLAQSYSFLKLNSVFSLLGNDDTAPKCWTLSEAAVFP